MRVLHVLRGSLPGGLETDCAALGSCGVPIPGDIAHLLRDLAFQSDAQLVLVVEKDAVFQVPAALPQSALPGSLPGPCPLLV